MPSATLRKRMHALERAAASAKQHSPDLASSSSHSAYIESDVPSSCEEEDSHYDESPLRASRSPPRVRFQENSRQTEHLDDTEDAHRSWYHFDPIVFLALLSPVGNWITGGDHVKNILLLAFLVFYLHHIIEGELSVFPQRFPFVTELQFRGDFSADNDDVARRLARSELHKLELLFLALSVASPFLGATFMHRAAGVLGGENVVSSFSVGLFVLATGIRPWSHLIERLSSRTSELQYTIHSAPRSPVDDLQGQMELLQQRLQVLEEKHKERGGVEEVYEYIDHELASVEKRLRRRDHRVTASLDVLQAKLQHALNHDDVAIAVTGPKSSLFDTCLSVLLFPPMLVRIMEQFLINIVVNAACMIAAYPGVGTVKT
ncbi:hypothetical protein FISHEDRAFT_59769 [Fistulina hepatica ATCC 64428]|uniref:Uncharacterized protein n=1 Tax=Fistulina hepatica ATCC 64428 TaxID=1128425 RepID=A0A0D7AA50_9AGAR|nr:hypothetical protein FISHEDRAFT_59769 [Fistulina hepatica ATCC 64428]